MAGDATSLGRVRELLKRTLTVGGGTLTSVMREQIAALRGVSGPVTMLELDIPADCPQSDLPDGPYQGPRDGVRIGVHDGARGDIGGVLLWIKDGRLDAFEYFWYTDDPPSELPRTEQLFGYPVAP